MKHGVRLSKRDLGQAMCNLCSAPEVPPSPPCRLTHLCTPRIRPGLAGTG